MAPFPLVAVDIGNNRTKLGLFLHSSAARLAEPERTFVAADPGRSMNDATAWLADAAARKLSWWIASVNRPAATSLVNWLHAHRPDDEMVLLGAADLAIDVAVPRPDMVGIDRLIDALAANELRDPDCPAVVVDVGSAITVDLVSADGAFCGGAILPGIAMGARAMHVFTDLLPQLDMTELTTPPPAIGISTVGAMQSGLYWGAVGAVRELVGRMAGSHAPQTQVFFTGGAGPSVAESLGASARTIPHLTLAGIALAARQWTRDRI
jgi:type III pantothenate kinase